MDDDVKVCRACRETKPLTEFHRMAKAPDGRQYRCKPCAITAARRRAEAKPEAKREADRRYATSDKVKERRRKARAEALETDREALLARKRADYAKHREKRVATQRAYRQRPEYAAGQRARYARWRERDPQGAHRNAIRRLYRMSMEEFDSLVLAHGGRCAICSRELVELHIDHRHSDGQVRGLLCPNCNRGIGLFYDSPDLLAAAITYLRG